MPFYQTSITTKKIITSDITKHLSYFSKTAREIPMLQREKKTNVK